jgi:hypothetical protein
MVDAADYSFDNTNALYSMLENFYTHGLCLDSLNSRFKDLQGTFKGPGDVPIEKAVKELILANIPNLIEYFLVYIDLPETVEGLVISKIKEFKRQQGVILDKINQKRKKLL